MECTTMVNGTICVEANVKVNAEVEVGEVSTYCIGRPCIRRCYRNNQFVYIAHQRLSVRFPLTFSPKIIAKPVGVVCESVSIEEDSKVPCKKPEDMQCCGIKRETQRATRCSAGGCPFAMLSALLSGRNIVNRRS